MSAPVNGTVAPGYEDVFDVFGRTFEHAEVGAGVCVYVDGRNVVDLWGGWADEAKTREWERDTIACTYSAVKGMTATCAHVAGHAREKDEITRAVTEDLIGDHRIADRCVLRLWLHASIRMTPRTLTRTWSRYQRVASEVESVCARVAKYLLRAVRIGWAAWTRKGFEAFIRCQRVPIDARLDARCSSAALNRLPRLGKQIGCPWCLSWCPLPSDATAMPLDLSLNSVTIARTRSPSADPFHHKHEVTGSSRVTPTM